MRSLPRERRALRGQDGRVLFTSTFTLPACDKQTNLCFSQAGSMWMYLKIASEASCAAGGWQRLPQSQALRKVLIMPILFAILFAAQLSELPVYPVPPEASGSRKKTFYYERSRRCFFIGDSCIPWIQLHIFPQSFASCFQKMLLVGAMPEYLQIIRYFFLILQNTPLSRFVTYTTFYKHRLFFLLSLSMVVFKCPILLACAPAFS